MTKKEIKQLDKLWSKGVVARANGKCEWCGLPKRLEAAHIFSRRNRSTRWLPLNGLALCGYCHRLGRMSAHQAPLDFSKFVLDKLGRICYNTLCRLAHKIVKNQDFETIKQELEKSNDQENIR